MFNTRTELSSDFSDKFHASNSGDVSLNDSDVEGGVLTYNTTPTVLPSNGTVVLNADGTFTYTPNGGFNGTDTFEYEVCDDGNPIECSNATVNIAIFLDDVFADGFEN